MYDSFDGIWRGWRRIYLHAFRKNPALLFQKFLSTACFTLIPFAAFIPLSVLTFQESRRYGRLWILAAVILVFITAIAWTTYGIIKAKKSYAVLHCLGTFFISLILLDACRMAITKEKTVWR
jgi:hypothetical protein